ncbi:hypothetical protein [Flagellimonas sp.]|uniref:hypothetical protein n=1 Tax=Flagellimonas sp. TaxID=2058762 RepID=UPI003F4A1D71
MTAEKEGRTTASIAYLTIVGSLIAMSMNMEPKNAFSRFHIRQAFGIHVMYHALAIVLTFTGIVQASFWLFILYIVIALYGLLSALNQQKKSLPWIGPFFQKWFTFIP